jgi:ABC-2 type transport system permease protein
VKSLKNIFHLGIKELRGLQHDTVLLLLVVYTFSFGVYGPASGTGTELRNASLALVDEDQSQLSERIGNAYLPSPFQQPEALAINGIDPAMDGGEFTFVVNVPPEFEKDVLRGRQPSLQVNVDATAMQQAGIGACYIRSIATSEIAGFLDLTGTEPTRAAQLASRIKFNPNLASSWFTAVMQIINNVTMLAIIPAGGVGARAGARHH